MPLTTPTGTKHELTLKEKVEVIKASSAGYSQRKIAEQFEIGKTQVCNILKRKGEYLSAYEENQVETLEEGWENELVNEMMRDKVVVGDEDAAADSDYDDPRDTG